jgi:hypothetical protein
MRDVGTLISQMTLEEKAARVPGRPPPSSAWASPRSSLRTAPTDVAEGLEVSVEVVNTGAAAGKEVVQLCVGARAFAYYHRGYGRWLTHSRWAPQRGTPGSRGPSRPSLLNRESTVREWLDGSRGQRVLGAMFGKMAEPMSASVGGDAEGGSAWTCPS